MISTKQITEIRNIATGARADARNRLAAWSAGDIEDGSLAGTVERLADALDLVADELDSHHRFLLDLRNFKADAV